MRQRPRLPRTFLAPLFLPIALSVGACSSYYEGPPSDHYDGKIFFNPENRRKKSFWDFLRWRFTADAAQWPEKIALGDVDPVLPKVEGAQLRVHFVNHATVLLQTQGLNILTDPIWSERASPLSWIGPKRVHPPGIAFDDLPRIDVVLLSHNHYDHLDVETLRRLWKRDAPRILCPLGNRAIFSDTSFEIPAEELDWDQSVPLNEQLQARLVQVQHWSARGLFDRDKALWGGFVLEAAAGNILFAGDTGYGPFLDRLRNRYPSFRLALIPLGAYEPRWFMKYGHVNPAEAVQLAQDLNAQHVLGIHYGTFQLSDEARTQPLEALQEALAAAAMPPSRFRVLEPGKAWELP